MKITTPPADIDVEKIKEIIRDKVNYHVFLKKSYKINKDGSIDINGHVNLNDESFIDDELPIQFNKSIGTFYLVSNETHLKSLDRLPRYCAMSRGNLGYSLTLALEPGRSAVTKIIDFPNITVKDGIDLTPMRCLTSLVGIHKKITLDGKFAGPKSITEGGLGLLLVKGGATDIFFSRRSERLTELGRILMKHLETKDVLECQEELIQNGMKEFARI